MTQRTALSIFRTLFLATTSLLSVAPLIWMLFAATNTSVDIVRGNVSVGGHLWTNVYNFFTVTEAALSVWNSIKITLVTSFAAVGLASLAGYSFEIFKSRRRDGLFFLLLATATIPPAATVIPQFLMMASLGLIDSHTAIILPGCASAFLVFYFRQITKLFPSALRDAAKLDGLSEIQIFIYIFVPVMRPFFISGFIIAFMSTWNAFMWPLIILQSDSQKTLPLIVSAVARVERPDYGIVMIGAIVTTLPALIVFTSLQRHFMRSITAGIH